MKQIKFSKIIPIALVLIVVAIIIAFGVSLVRSTFFSGSSNTTLSLESDPIRQGLVSTTDDGSVRMTIRGELVADEDFRTMQITISPIIRLVTTASGYTGAQTEQKMLINNIPAYEQFVYALDKANFTKGSVASDVMSDLRGICATGKVYEFEVLKSNQPVSYSWTSNCLGSRGTFRAGLNQITELFYDQIPDIKSIINSTW